MQEVGRVRLHAAEWKASGRAESSAFGLVLVVQSTQAYKHYGIQSGVFEGAYPVILHKADVMSTGVDA